MSLRAKLLLVALSILTLPWAGWQFVRQMETLLRQGQEQALVATAEAVVRALAAQPAVLPAAGPAWFVPQLESPPQLDGDNADWPLPAQNLRRFTDPAIDTELAIALGDARDALYLFAQVRDASPARADAYWANAAQRDHLRLVLDGSNGRLTLRIANAADGALVVSDEAGRAPALRVAGMWRETGTGYQIELRLPQGYPLHALSLLAIDADGAGNAHRVGSAADTPWPLRTRSEPLAAALMPLLPGGARARVTDTQGWVLAAAGALHDDGVAEEVPPWRRWAYRWLLLDNDTSADDAPDATVRSQSAETRAALAGTPGAAWRRDPDGERLLLRVAVPLPGAANDHGALLIERESESVLLLTDRALTGLLGATLLALLGTGAVVFVFAGRLSARVRRLRDAAERAMDRDSPAQPLPGTDSRDEIGDLSRSFAQLLDEVAAYTAYLRSLASKLSHEINTPLAIVRSSLDNLAGDSLPAPSQPYLERARSGVDRLGMLVRAMSEATRIEQAIASIEPERFDLAGLLRECGEAYRSVLAPRRLDLVLPDGAMPLHGAPELIVQALDKLIDNARSFCPEDGWVRIALHADAHGAVLAVANTGPGLPADMRDKLFDSLVSVRSRNRADGSIHLGLGLHVVKLVADLHRGSVQAHDLADGTGVQFSLHLQGIRTAMPRV
ncbi:MAG: histidine kinase [Gammaproteobacteria bacterium HGW-Gammaproteobacteria-4]|jgi:dedicated sortase system histidine kinase|nr:MAG: histidine kinase [Gammaproteobacteria bacterium HGW-Gammaproteobacteria-4]